MARRANCKIPLLLLFLLAAIAVAAACNSNIAQPERSTITQLDASTSTRLPAETRVVSHAFGRVKVPSYPQRIVVLDGSVILDPVLALGVSPVGSSSCSICLDSHSGIPNELVADIPVVGDNAQPSLEKILTLKPDLIFIHKWQKQLYSKLSEIAPTVAVDTETEADFKKILKYIAQILGRSDRAEEILAQYGDRIQKLRQQVEEKLQGKKVSVVQLKDSQIFIYEPKITAYSQIMLDAGIQFIPAYANLTSGFILSNEMLPLYDADFLFVVVIYQRDSENLKSLSFLEQPMWSTLKAVQNKQVYAVNWGAGGTIGANQVIDDLYKYLINTSQ